MATAVAPAVRTAIFSSSTVSFLSYPRTPSAAALHQLQQLDVQLGAGRVELTDLNINVIALAELLPPGLSFRLAHTHVGTLRIEISYSKLLTESLAIFLDDVQIEVTPPLSEAVTASPPGAGVDAEAQESGQANAAVITSRQEGLAAGAAGTGTNATQNPLADQDQFGFGESGERLDFLAKWIEQITSKVKVIVSDLTVRIAAEARAEGGRTGQRSSGGGENRTPCLELRCSSLKWCDETPEVSSFMADQSASTGVNRAEGPGKVNGGTAAVVHKVSIQACRKLTSREPHAWPHLFMGALLSVNHASYYREC